MVEAFSLFAIFAKAKEGTNAAAISSTKRPWPFALS
jgi:hypothetical protein